jgi:hypothetical protein
MPTLTDALRGRDMGFLKMVANAWGLELSAPDTATALPQVVEGILGHQWRDDVLAALPRGAQSALQYLLKSDGRLSWAVFVRRYGEVRPFGPGKREKERPDLKPISPAEVLWYRALIGRAILPGDVPPIEYAYIPEDLLDLLGPLGPGEEALPGRPATPTETAHLRPANDRLLDHATTLLAALRQGLPLAELDTSLWPLPAELLLELLKAARLVDDAGLPLAEPTRAFLESSRGQALTLLATEWMHALYLNELRLLPGLKFEGDWLNDPLAARQALLNWLGKVPADASWWNLASFVKAIHDHDPDFQRPAGDYDSWFIRSTASGEFLRGFECWDEVDGALVRFFISGPLHWLGFLDLAAPDAHAPAVAFRLSAWAEDLFHGSPARGLPEETGKLKLTSAGLISVPRLAPRALRYQIARFCLWGHETNEDYRYRIAPAGLERAAAQGLRPRQLMGLLRRHIESDAIPPALIQGLERWESAGTQASVENAVLLRLAHPGILEALKKTRAARFIQEEISPTLVSLHPGTQEKVLEALNEIGYLGDLRREE